MLALPPAANSEDVSVADGDIIQGVEGPGEEVDADSPRDESSTTAQVDDRDEDTPDINRNLNNLDMDRSSVYENHAESDIEEHVPAADNPGGVADDARQQEDSKQEQEQGEDQGAGESKTQDAHNDSSTTNTDEAADSDAKTADTVGTSTSFEEPANNSRSSKVL